MINILRTYLKSRFKLHIESRFKMHLESIYISKVKFNSISAIFFHLSSFSLLNKYIQSNQNFSYFCC